MASHDLLDHVHVGGRAHERERNCVHAVFQAELEILAIFFRHGGNRQGRAWKIDALMFAQTSAIQNIADHVLATHRAHAQCDEAVAQEYSCAGGDLSGKIGEGRRDTGGCAGDIARSNDHGRAALQFDRFMPFEPSSADLGALQILQDADGAAFFFRGAAQAFDVAGVIFVRAVGKIQAGNVHAEAKQVAHRSLGVAGRADGADDLGAARGGGCKG